MTEDQSQKTIKSTVLVVTHYYGAHGGGIERVADKLIDEVLLTGLFNFVWAASDVDKSVRREGLEPLPMRATNFVEKALGLPCPLWSPKSLRRLKRAVADADLVWLHDTLYMGNILAARWAHQMNKPVVITQHIGFIPYKNPLLRLAMKLAEKLFTYRMLKAASQATFISDRTAEYFYQHVPFARSIQIIPNGVEARLYYPASSEKRAWLRQQFALKSEQPVMLFVGRFVEKKGLSALRELARLLPEWRFWLAGNGPIKPECWHLPNVHAFRDRGGESLAELYQAADLLLLPSYGEGFPLVIQEALACGLPVVCSPDTAAGSRLAAPQLVQADVWPANPVKTAETWAGILRSIGPQLPRPVADDRLARFASSTWGWPVIAGAYTEIFLALCRKRP